MLAFDNNGETISYYLVHHCFSWLSISYHFRRHGMDAGYCKRVQIACDGEVGKPAVVWEIS
jgi:hypothetical protein